MIHVKIFQPAPQKKSTKELNIYCVEPKFILRFIFDGCYRLDAIVIVVVEARWANQHVPPVLPSAIYKNSFICI